MNRSQVRIGVAQFAPALGEFDQNVTMVLEALEEAGRLECDLVVLPECATSGFMLETREAALSCADEIPGSTTDAISAVAAAHGMHCVVGMLERDGDALHNSAVLIGPGGLIGRYRKTHLPRGGVDRFVTAGDELKVFDTPIGRIGIEICYDLRFPEVTRALALKGAQIIAHPTNWPVLALPTAEFVTRARAYDNRIVLATANRYGPDGWGEFCGHSQIVGLNGDRLAQAPGDRDAVLVAEVDLPQASDRVLVTRPDEYELWLFEDRRQDLYAELVSPAALATDSA
jgi:5-aminopentanamidase